jgi:hypothetical protein
VVTAVVARCVAGGWRLAVVTALVALTAAACGGGTSTPADATNRPAQPPATANAAPEVIDCSFDKPAVRPANLILACADLGIRVEQISWTSWGPDKAEGDGIEHDNTCDPNCAAGHFVTKPVHITLSDVVEPGHVFTKATTIDAAGATRTHPLVPR